MAKEKVSANKDDKHFKEPDPSVPTTDNDLGDTAPQRPHDDPSAKPKSYMTSTWHEGTSHFKLLFSNPLRAILYDLMFRGEPEQKVSDKIPVHSVFAQHVFVFPRTLPPMLYQYWAMKYNGEEWSPLYAYFVYTVYYILFSKMTLSHFNNMVAKYGYLDNKAGRDNVPDNSTTSTAIALIAYAALRPIVGVTFLFDPKQLPALSPWLPVHLFVFTTVMDFFFYVYHRAMHEVDFLWRFHKTHHMTKHPTSILSAFADEEQDLCDILVIPGLALLCYRVDFFTWWVCQIYILFVEASGHSGVRCFIQAPVGSPILQFFDMDLLLEDHDLHHRQGWRKSANYGKQTRVWDKLFGSTRDRVECNKDQVDWNNRGDWIDMLI